MEVVSLIEMLAEDPQIKRQIHGLSHFAGSPYLTHHGRKTRPSFYALSLLLHKGMALLLVPHAATDSVRAAAIKPLHLAVFRAFSALCRFDRENKVAVAATIADDLIWLLTTTNSNALQAVILECMHSLSTEFTNLDRRVRRAFSTLPVQKTLKRLVESLGDVQIMNSTIHGSSLAKKTEALIFGILKR